MHLSDATLAGRAATGHAPTDDAWTGTGRELFAGLRATVGPATHGASVFQSDFA